MREQQKLLMDYLSNSKVALEKLQDNGFTFLDGSFVWQILIYELGHSDIPTEVLFHNLSSDDIISLVTDYFDKNGLPVKNISTEVSILPDDLYNDLIKAQVKFKGEIWTIHKNDRDTFPSQPHAHNYDRQYKLHLGNGKLFRNKNEVGCINKKDLIRLREKITTHITEIKLPNYANN
jgi:hypothetical protein